MATKACAAALNGLNLGEALFNEIAAARTAFANEDVDQAIHRGRVLLKRIRAYARLADSKSLNRAAREVMSMLSPDRDLAVLEGLAKSWAEKAPASAAVFARLGADIARERASLPPPPIVAARRALANVEREAATVLDRKIDVGAAVEQITERARKAYRKAQDDSAVDLRHEWRKREKDRAHAIAILGDAWPPNLKRRRAMNVRLARLLGEERDVGLLRERLRAAPSADEAEEKRALRALKTYQDHLALRADALGARLHRGGV